MHRCIVTVGTGNWYPRGVRRLQETLRRVRFAGDMLCWVDDLPPGSPTHHDTPYGFKVAALDHARMRGYDTVLWCDASTWFLQNPAPLFEQIERDGYYIWRNPLENMGEFAADKSLRIMDVDREESFIMPSAVATIFGLAVQDGIGREILSRMSDAMHKGAFSVPWINDTSLPGWTPGERAGYCSQDPRVLGGRHDQTVLSCIAHQLGLVLDDRVPSALIGYPSVPHADSVVALAEDDGGASMDAWEREGYLKR